MNRLASRLGIRKDKLLGLLVMVIAVVVIFTTYNGALKSLVAKDGATVTATFANSKTLAKNDPVRIRGVEVGKVKDIQPLSGARGSRVTMSVGDAGDTLRPDASAKVSWRSLLGGAFFVNIDPGHAPGELGGKTIPIDRTESQVELDDVTTTFQPDAQRGLRTFPGQLAEGLRDPGPPAQTFKKLADAAPDITKGVGALRGQNKDKDLVALVRNTSRTVRAIDTPTDDLKKTVSGAAATLETTGNREADLRNLLANAPRSVRETEATLTGLDQTLAIANPLVNELRPPASQLAPALRRLNPTVKGADKLLTRAVPLLRALRPTARSLSRTATNGRPLLTDLQPSIDRLQKTILPYFNEKDPESGYSTATMVGPGLGGLGLVSSQFDSNGNFIRFPAATGGSAAYLPCQYYLGNPNSSELVACKSINQIFNDYTKYDPTAPPPGSTP